MVEQVLMKASKRTAVGTKAVRKLRNEGVIPGVVYGEGKEPLNIQVDPKELDAFLHGGHRLISLEVDGKRITAVVKEVQYDHLGKKILHADFERVSAGHEISVTVPLELHGTPRGIKEGGRLDFTHREVHVRCVPGKLPESIRVEVAHLGLSEGVYVRDIEVPDGVEILDEPDTCVAIVQPPKGAVEEEEEAAEEAPAEPEVVGKKTEDEQPQEGGKGS